MESKNDKLSNAIILFIGLNSEKSPGKYRSRLIQVFGDLEAATLESQIAAILDEVSKIKIDWSIHSLESAGKFVRSEMGLSHPDLSDLALQALEWKFTFDWR